MAHEQLVSTPIEHVVVVENPVSSQARRFKSELDELKRKCDEHNTGFTQLITKPSAADNRDMLFESVPQRSTLVVVGGDGTLHAMADSMLREHSSRPDHLPNTPILTVPAGKKNDMHGMLHDFPAPFWPQLTRERVQVPTLAISLKDYNDHSTSDRIALYSFGLGAIGRGAEIINSPAFRAAQQRRHWLGQKLGELSMGIQAYRETDMQAFTLNPAGSDQQTEEIDTQAIVCSNGEAMAGGWRFPSRLTEPGFFMGPIGGKNPLRTLLDVARLYRGTLPGKVYREPVSIRVYKEIMGQADGEHLPVQPGEVTVSSGPELTFFTTRLTPLGTVALSKAGPEA